MYVDRDEGRERDRTPGSYVCRDEREGDVYVELPELFREVVVL